MLFRDRTEAGRALAAKLARYAGRSDVVVLALPRGGVPVAWEVARSLRAPLDVYVVRKLGVPGHEELAMGAIASGGVRVLTDAVHMLGISTVELAATIDKEQRELERREHLYRGERAALDVAGKVAILIDDGLATGSTMRAALLALRQKQPARVVVAVPVGAASTCTGFETEADEVVCVRAPDPFYAVGTWYDDFSPTSDNEVRRILALAAARADKELGDGKARAVPKPTATLAPEDRGHQS